VFDIFLGVSVEKYLKNKVVEYARKKILNSNGEVKKLKKGNDNAGIYTCSSTGREYVLKITKNMTELLFCQYLVSFRQSGFGVIDVCDLGQGYGLIVMNKLYPVSIDNRYDKQVLIGVIDSLKIVNESSFVSLRFDDERKSAGDKAKAHFKKVESKYFSDNDSFRIRKVFEMHKWDRTDVLSHGDVHYGNIGFDLDGNIVVFDFGTLGYREVGYDLRYYFRDFSDGILHENDLNVIVETYSGYFDVEANCVLVNAALAEISTNCWRLSKHLDEKYVGKIESINSYKKRIFSISEFLLR